jgi:hypothetical protein
MPTINIAPKAMQNGDNVTTYKDTVGPQQQTYTFLTSQERVILKNSGSKNITYTVGSQSGTLGPSQMVDVKETISSINLTNYSGAGNFNGIGNFAIQGAYGASAPINVKRVRVYNMALTADEVLQNYNSGN